MSLAFFSGVTAMILYLSGLNGVIAVFLVWGNGCETDLVQCPTV